MNDHISERTLIREKAAATLEYRLEQVEDKADKHEDRLDAIEAKVSRYAAIATGAAGVVTVFWTIAEKFL